MEIEFSNITKSSIDDYKFTTQNTSCTGGTITDIYVSVSDTNTEASSYVLTLKELRSCAGFEDVTTEEANEIIQTLCQLSNITYQALNDE